MRKHITVIGGGILGCMIARRILETFPKSEVTIIDSTLLGSGASMYSVGVHFPVGRSKRVKYLSTTSATYYSELLLQHPDLPIYPVEFLVAAQPEYADDILKRCMDLEAASIDLIGHDLFCSQQDFNIWKMPSCHVADVFMLVQKLSCSLRQRAHVLESVNVLKIAENKNTICISLSNGNDLHADKVVLAPGPWANTPPFCEYTANLGIRIKKVVALHLDRIAGVKTGIFFPIPDLFLVPFIHRGHWILSYTSQQWDVSPADCMRAFVTTTELIEAQTLLDTYVPTLVSRLTTGRIFCDAYSPNKEPIVTSVGKTRNIVFAGAANGSGYRLAPGIAAEVSELLIQQ